MKMLLGREEGPYAMAYRPVLPSPIVGAMFDHGDCGWLLSGGCRWLAAGVGWHRIPKYLRALVAA